MKKILFTLLVLSSFIMFFSFVFEDNISSTIVEKNNKKGEIVLNTISPQEIEVNLSREVPNHNEEIEPITLPTMIKTVSKNPEPIYRENLVGQLIIPSRNTNLGIFHGVTNENLLLGASTMKMNQKMGEGNYALAGHFQFKDGVLFHAVYDIEIGTSVYLTDKRTVYHYKIYDRDIFPEDAHYLIENEESEKRGNPILTLMTCPISSKHKTRIFARADLIESYPYESGMFSEPDQFREQ